MFCFAVNLVHEEKLAIVVSVNSCSGLDYIHVKTFYEVVELERNVKVMYTASWHITQPAASCASDRGN